MDGLFCQVSLADYAVHCNTEKLIILQIESPEALANVEEIAAVPGFDALLFGAGDYSHRIGMLGQATAPQVVAARRRVARAARAHGKHSMAPSLFGQREMLVEEGTDIFTLGADVLELGSSFRKLVSDFHGAPGPVASDSAYAAKR
jgi:4-hydroxy-2-oxoheptanedioate aldolase